MGKITEASFFQFWEGKSIFDLKGTQHIFKACKVWYAMKEGFKEGLKDALEEEYVTRDEVTAANAVMKEKVQDYCSKYTHAAAALDPNFNNPRMISKMISGQFPE